MGDEDRWGKLEGILRRVIGEELDARGIKAKTKINFVNGQWTGVTAEQLSTWRAAYGAVDVDSEMKKAAAWIASNPLQAPKNNFARFMNSWLSKQQNFSSIRSIPTRSDPAPMICAYCSSPASGSTGGYKHCSSRECFDKAMGGERPRKTA